jgi:endonuclease/exonuclease/phosphatase family metal-dependent hydrolase
MADHRSVPGESLACLSREKVAFCEWVRPRVSRHAFIEVVPAGERIRVFGVHLSAVIAAWTEQRRVMELRALLEKHRSASRPSSRARRRLQHHRSGRDGQGHAAAAALASVPVAHRRPRAVANDPDVLDSGYVDTFRMLHPDDPGLTLPTSDPILRLDYTFLPHAQAGRATKCEVVRNAIAVGASDHFPVLAEMPIDALIGACHAVAQGAKVGHTISAHPHPSTCVESGCSRTAADRGRINADAQGSGSGGSPTLLAGKGPGCATSSAGGVADPRDVEDIVQDVFSELVEANRMLMPIDHVTGWLFRVARNRIIDLFRRKKPERLAEDGEERLFRRTRHLTMRTSAACCSTSSKTRSTSCRRNSAMCSSRTRSMERASRRLPPRPA